MLEMIQQWSDAMAFSSLGINLEPWSMFGLLMFNNNKDDGMMDDIYCEQSSKCSRTVTQLILTRV